MGAIKIDTQATLDSLMHHAHRHETCGSTPVTTEDVEGAVHQAMLDSMNALLAAEDVATAGGSALAGAEAARRLAEHMDVLWAKVGSKSQQAA